ncbi:MAG: ketopantoate reductase family protein [Candidatus Zhuqueibacterota bacterium]
MNILIVGTGVIGTIYGWALQAAGLNITHLVRKGKGNNFQDGVTIDVLDERKGYKKYNKTTYPIKVIEMLDKNSSFDLVIVPTNYYQTEEALKTVVPLCCNSFFYILTSNWTGTQLFDGTLRKHQYLLGYPDGGGTIRDNVYWANIGPEIHIAAPDEHNQQGFELIEKAFASATIKLDVQENILHWLWVHNAGSAAIWAATLKYRNIKKYLADKALLKKSFLATRECLALCEKRGASSKGYPEISAFKMPMWLLIPMFKFNFKHNESMKRYTAHADNAPKEDVLINFRDILATAKELGFDMPNFKELEQFLK